MNTDRHDASDHGRHGSAIPKEEGRARGMVALVAGMLMTFYTYTGLRHYSR